MVHYGDLPLPESSCGAGSFMDTLSAYKIIGASVLFGVGVIISYFLYWELKQLANILWYHFMVSIDKRTKQTVVGGS